MGRPTWGCERGPQERPRTTGSGPQATPGRLASGPQRLFRATTRATARSSATSGPSRTTGPCPRPRESNFRVGRWARAPLGDGPCESLRREGGRRLFLVAEALHRQERLCSESHRRWLPARWTGGYTRLPFRRRRSCWLRRHGAVSEGLSRRGLWVTWFISLLFFVFDFFPGLFLCLYDFLSCMMVRFPPRLAGCPSRRESALGRGAWTRRAGCRRLPPFAAGLQTALAGALSPGSPRPFAGACLCVHLI
mmetsp:Transcript_1115/g.2866  ORF Transcript_1115/g.2866 Transcript_1115/m.2866 type:complete len:250 (-) Transcript_1115:26-775(-)